MLKPLRVYGHLWMFTTGIQNSWDSQDFGDVNIVSKMANFHKSTRPQWVNCLYKMDECVVIWLIGGLDYQSSGI